MMMPITPRFLPTEALALRAPEAGRPHRRRASSCCRADPRRMLAPPAVARLAPLPPPPAATHRLLLSPRLRWANDNRLGERLRLRAPSGRRFWFGGHSEPPASRGCVPGRDGIELTKPPALPPATFPRAGWGSSHFHRTDSRVSVRPWPG